MRSIIRSSTIMLIVAVVLLLNFLPSAPAQSGKGTTAGRRTIMLNVIAHTPEGRQVTREDFDLYDSGTPQEIESFTRLDTGSRIVLMIDSSTSLRAELPALQKAVEAVVNELYADDQMMVIGLNENAEIIEDMTPDLKKLQAASTKIIRKGFPNLFDALIAVSDSLSSQARTGFEKRAIFLISDGYDSESKMKFADALQSLQDENIILFALQVPDRTRGALLRDKPKPPAALQQLTSGTGGAIYPLDHTEEAAKTFADDLRKNWYRLVYAPSGITTFNARRLLLMPHDDKIELRTKGFLPGRLHPTN